MDYKCLPVVYKIMCLAASRLDSPCWFRFGFIDFSCIFKDLYMGVQVLCHPPNVGLPMNQRLCTAKVLS